MPATLNSPPHIPPASASITHQGHGLHTVEQTRDESLHEAVAAVQNGGHSSFEIIYDHTIAELKAWISFHAHSWDMVEECVQQTYIAAYQAIAGFDSERPLMPWLKGIAKHQMSKYLRREIRLKSREYEAFIRMQLDRVEQTEQVIADTDDISARLSACLQRLGESLRHTIWQRYVEHKSIQVIAQELQRSANSLSVMLHRARAALRSCISNGDGNEASNEASEETTDG